MMCATFVCSAYIAPPSTSLAMPCSVLFKILPIFSIPEMGVGVPNPLSTGGMLVPPELVLQKFREALLMPAV